MRTSFDCEVIVQNVAVNRVVDAYWNLEQWCGVAPHVIGIDVLYGDESAQVMVMTVCTRGHVDSFKSVRAREGNVIRYVQPRPPPILTHHHGSWSFEAVPDGTRVVSRHVVEVDLSVASALLGELRLPAKSEDEVRTTIQSLVRSNSLQTMHALRERLEGEARCVPSQV
jgi:hypothetical protein